MIIDDLKKTCRLSAWGGHVDQAAVVVDAKIPIKGRAGVGD